MGRDFLKSAPKTRSKRYFQRTFFWCSKYYKISLKSWQLNVSAQDKVIKTEFSVFLHMIHIPSNMMVKQILEKSESKVGSGP